MNNNIKDKIFIPEHRTNILPLRWLANYIFHPMSMWFFKMGLSANHRWEYDYSTYKFRHLLMEKFGWRMYYYLDKPYSKWGTIYRMDSVIFDEEKTMMMSKAWDDYDEFSTAYCDYWWHEDPITGDGWRIIKIS